MVVIKLLVVIISALLIFFLVMPFLTVFFSLFTKDKIRFTKKEDGPYKNTDYGCIITAYKNADIAIPLVQSLIKQEHQNLHVYLVADECDISNIEYTHPKFTLLHPNPSLRLKAKSIIYAIEKFVRPHEYIAVFDADNLAHPKFLSEINKFVSLGHRSVQGQRTAKNLDTVYACADATGEFYKNYIDRYVPYLLGSSAVISGSGMAVEAELYKAYLASPEIEQGKHLWKKMLQEDKILQNNLLFKKEKISYAWDAIVYDEKVVSGEQVETQRTRWLFSYFQNLKNSSGLLLKGILGFNYNQLLFGLVTIAPPLFILLFSSMLMTVVSLLVDPWISLALASAIFIFAMNIFWVLYLSKAPKPIWQALWGIPLFVWNQVKALFKMGNPNKNFKHSEHTRKVSIDDVLKSEKEL